MNNSTVYVGIVCGLSWFGIAVGVLSGWWWLAVLCILTSTMVRGSLGMVCIAVLLDGYFGAFAAFPWLTMFAVVWFLLVDWLQDRLLVTESVRL